MNKDNDEVKDKSEDLEDYKEEIEVEDEGEYDELDEFEEKEVEKKTEHKEVKGKQLDEGTSYLVAAFCHLSWLIGLPIVGPLVVYLLVENKDTKDHAKEAMGWQMMLTIGYFLAGIMTMLVIGIIFIPVLFIIQIIYSIKATKSALHGDKFEYPVSSKYIQNL